MVKIEAGVEELLPSPGDGLRAYKYRYWQGVVEIIVVFLAPEDVIPEIGDFIEAGMLIKRDGWQINDDTSKWDILPKETW